MSKEVNTTVEVMEEVKEVIEEVGEVVTEMPYIPKKCIGKKVVGVAAVTLLVAGGTTLVIKVKKQGGFKAWKKNRKYKKMAKKGYINQEGNAHFQEDVYSDEVNNSEE